MAKTDTTHQIYAKAVKALMRKVCGYTLAEQKTTYIYNAEGERVVKDEVLVKKSVGPDLEAIRFVLTNLKPQQWQDKPDYRTTCPESDPDTPPLDLSRLSQAALEELERLYKE